MKKIEKSVEIGGRKLTLSTGYFASQASGAVMASYGETVVLGTVVAQPLTNDPGYFPLTLEYQEKLYAGGKIKGSRWVKREGRPSDDEILVARLIDRSLRPLFPKNYKKEVQIITTVLSVDLENTPEIVAAIAATAAVAISDIPWYGPLGIVKVGTKDGNLITNPVQADLKSSEMDLIVSSTSDAIVMIESGSNQVPEEKIIDAIVYAQKEGQKIIKLIEDLVKDAGKKKEAVEGDKVNKDLQREVEKKSMVEVKGLIGSMSTKEAGYSEYDRVKKALIDTFNDNEKSEASYLFEELFKKELRKQILSGKRPDGRKSNEIRALSAEVGVLPRTHGSAVFNRGQTQALSIATLGAPSLEQSIETAEGEETKRYIHHYIMPPYSTGETGKMGFPSRREIGHGALAEKALIPVIPNEDKFPYTVQVVTEILSSNGSTSMASACGSTLSLMDAGVPITAPIAGIAMGLVIESKDKFVVLTDIVGLEDGHGDMDFKVAGSREGITALQLDVKTLNLTSEILKKALSEAKVARLAILDVMNKALDKPRSLVSKYAPKIKTVKINPEKIGELIGPGGKTIRKIIADTGSQVDVDEDGTVFISGTTEDGLEKAIKQVELITKDPQAGEIYEGVVKRVQSFGVFVEILPKKEGLVHVSDMAETFVKDPSDILKIGDSVQVRVKGIDDLGRLNLSMVLDPSFDSKKEERNKDRGPRRFEGKSKSDFKSAQRFGGPHFPTSRFLEQRGRRK